MQPPAGGVLDRLQNACVVLKERCAPLGGHAFHPSAQIRSEPKRPVYPVPRAQVCPDAQTRECTLRQCAGITAHHMLQDCHSRLLARYHKTPWQALQEAAAPPPVSQPGACAAARADTCTAHCRPPPPFHPTHTCIICCVYTSMADCRACPPPPSTAAP